MFNHSSNNYCSRLLIGLLLLLMSCTEPPLPQFDLLINNEDYSDTRQMAGLPNGPVPGVAPGLEVSGAIMLSTGLEKDQDYTIQWFVDGMEYPKGADMPKLELVLETSGRHQIKVCIRRGEQSRCQEKILFITGSTEQEPVSPFPPPPPADPGKTGAQEGESVDSVTEREHVEEEVLQEEDTTEVESVIKDPPPPPPPSEYKEVGQIGAQAAIYRKNCGFASNNEVEVTLSPKKHLILSRFSVQATSCGLLEVKVTGEGLSWQNTQTLTPGRNTISVIGMAQELLPGNSYTISVLPKPSRKCPEGSPAPALGDARNCNSEASIRNEELQLDYQKERVAIFDLVYNHAE